MSINERVKQILTTKNISAAQFAKALDVSPQYVSKLINDGSVGLNVVNKIIELFPDVSSDWLIAEKGSMYKDSPLFSGHASEPEVKYGACQECEKLKKEIEHLKERLKDKEEMIEILKGQKKCISTETPKQTTGSR